MVRFDTPVAVVEPGTAAAAAAAAAAAVAAAAVHLTTSQTMRTACGDMDGCALEESSWTQNVVGMEHHHNFVSSRIHVCLRCS